MVFQERLDEIIKILSKRKKITVQELTERLNVSEVTIRKDLSILEEQGKIERIHGGAVLAEDKELIRNINVRFEEHVEEKIAIAKRAMELIREGDTIYLDSGSTSYFLARELNNSGINVRILTNSLDVITELSDSPYISLLSTGGSLRREARSFIGPIAIETIRNFQIETSFLGTTGFSEEGIFSAQNTLEAEVKKSVIKSSKRTVMLVDHHKFGTTAFSIFARPEDIDILITDSGCKDRKKILSLGIETIFAELSESNPIHKTTEIAKSTNKTEQNTNGSNNKIEKKQTQNLYNKRKQTHGSQQKPVRERVLK